MRTKPVTGSRHKRDAVTQVSILVFAKVDVSMNNHIVYIMALASQFFINFVWLLEYLPYSVGTLPLVSLVHALCINLTDK